MATARNRLEKIPVRWLLCWLLLPNLAVVLMWPLIGIPMQAGLLISGGLALIISQLPWHMGRAIGVFIIFLFVTTVYVCHLFAIPPLNFRLIFQSLSDVRPLNSPEYAFAGAVLLLILFAAVYLAPRVPRFCHGMQFLYAVLAILGFVHLDRALAFDARQSNRSLPGIETPVDSAAMQVDLHPLENSRRHVVVILVEALGVPVTSEEKALFAGDWDRPQWRERYDVEHGLSKFFGSTTNAELRELCAQWSHYKEFDFSKADCLPRRFVNSGYGTMAIHSFGGALFDREDWYPKIGFGRMMFADDLYSRGVRSCPGVFPGACDVDVPPIITRHLVEADAPQFLYWLTLNAHLPVVAEKSLGTDRCVIGSKHWQESFPALCRLFQLHGRIADSISIMAMTPDLPPTDILIVGDHKPPMFDRASNERFDAGHVPWIYLRWKEKPREFKSLASEANGGRSKD